MKKLALVLGGGAAKGYAHIGVIKELEKHGIVPDLIVGTSMGALIGGMYASGKTAFQLEQMALKFNSLGNFSLISTLFKDNMISTSKINKLLNREFKDTRYEDCKIKFISIATDIEKGKEARFSSGLLKEGVLASISIPGAFPRCKLNGTMYADGGMMNNLPEDVAKEIMPDAVVLSVDVIGEYSKQLETCKLQTLASVLNAMTLLTSNVIKNRPQYADLRLTISMPNISQVDFNSKACERAIKKGQSMAKKHITEIEELLRG